MIYTSGKDRTGCGGHRDRDRQPEREREREKDSERERGRERGRQDRELKLARTRTDLHCHVSELEAAVGDGVGVGVGAAAWCFVPCAWACCAASYYAITHFIIINVNVAPGMALTPAAGCSAPAFLSTRLPRLPRQNASDCT